MHMLKLIPQRKIDSLCGIRNDRSKATIRIWAFAQCILVLDHTVCYLLSRESDNKESRVSHLCATYPGTHFAGRKTFFFFGSSLLCEGGNAYVTHRDLQVRVGVVFGRKV